MKNSLDSKKEYYRDNGYVIIENLISNDDINKILTEFTSFTKSNSLYFSQSENNWRKAKSDVDKFGLLSYSLENFTDLIWKPNFSNAGREILQSQKVLDILQLLSKEQDFCILAKYVF